MGKRRRTIHLPGVGHGEQPIPLAVRVGNVLVSSGISGQDPATGSLPDDPAQQVSLIFRHVRDILEAAGGTPDDIVRLTFFVKDRAYRRFINAEWVAMFPDPEDRPSRHVLTYDLPGGMLVQCELWAVLPPADEER